MTQLSITTTQNVNINFSSASLGVRILALCIDLLILTAYLTFIFWLVMDLFHVGRLTADWDYWSAAALNIMLCLPAMFYSLLMESIFEGQTLGKRLLKIKVVKIDGYQAGFGDYLIRWLMKLIDLFFAFGLVGLIASLVSDKTQRLGDMAAGTAVITLKSNVTIDSTILEEIDAEYVPTYPGVIKLTDNDIRIIKETYQVALKDRDYHIFSRLCMKIEQVTGIRNQSGSDEIFVAIVLKDYNYYTRNM
ncbi:MAG: RDD family protein [Flavobacterium sp. BFFFF1]|uniref:RDD family protein n=1 Tax=unclassified Flavobacterium TaxID=196869 RepID=UPI000BD572E7|nr:MULTISPECIES: RDD family protein [unclassified Flavobacterium]OYU80168.1 MAG: RDD family protein [Flavobacterium sp. BFFFF1]